MIAVMMAGLSIVVGLAAGQGIPPSRPKPATPPARPRDPMFPPPGNPGEGKTADQLVRVRALANVDHIVPGSTFKLAFEFTIEPHWHIYWKNSGASGGATEIKVTAPAGFAIGKTIYPRPESMRGEEGVSYGYEDKVIIFVEVKAPPESTTGSATFNANINWMVCKDVCLLGRARQMITLPVTNSDTLSPMWQAVDGAVKEWEKRLPQALSDVKDSDIRFEGTTLTIRIPAQGRAKGEFFPLEMPGVTYGNATIKVEADILSVSVPVTIKPGDSLGKPMTIAGVVGLGDTQADPSYEFEIPPTAP